jgi:hypothetical protein
MVPGVGERYKQILSLMLSAAISFDDGVAALGCQLDRRPHAARELEQLAPLMVSAWQPMRNPNPCTLESPFQQPVQLPGLQWKLEESRNTATRCSVDARAHPEHSPASPETA